MAQGRQKGKKKDAIDIVIEGRELNDKEAERSAARKRGDKETEDELDAVLTEAARQRALSDFYAVPPKSALAQFKDRDKDGKVTDFWAEQANWNRRTGETPLEFLTRVYRNPLVSMDERIRAATAARDLVHKHLPNLSVIVDEPGTRGAGTRERIVDRILGLAREPEEAGQEGNSGGKAGDRKAKR